MRELDLERGKEDPDRLPEILPSARTGRSAPLCALSLLPVDAPFGESAGPDTESSLWQGQLCHKLCLNFWLKCVEGPLRRQSSTNGDPEQPSRLAECVLPW